jgi:shikimate 5-dehydrogenase
MRPEEIRPDTKLCTILGYNAQTSNRRRYFNRILKLNGINATAIALNIKDEHFNFTMKNLPNSKVDRVILEDEFQREVLEFCKNRDELERAEFIEVDSGEIIGHTLDISSVVERVEFFDENMILATKMMILANRWYGAKIDLDLIPTII